MKYLAYLAATLAIAPSIIISVAALPQADVATTPSSPAKDVNPYLGKSPFPIPGYAKKLEATIDHFKSKKDFLNAARTKTVQDTATFTWISASKDVPNVKGLVKDALNRQFWTRQKQLVQVVVYNLPDRDCSAKASDGEFHLDDDGLNKYYKFVDSVAAQLDTKEAKQLDFVLVLEPDSLGNLVTNMAVPKCAGAADAYRAGVSYAIAKLHRPNVALYLDAAHGGWLGWNDNLAPSAKVFAEVLAGAQKINKNAKVRGLATNVSNYNQYVSAVRENFTEWSNSWDEWHYVQSLAPHLEEAGYPAHFIIDQGRAGKGAIRTEWSQWCNVRNAGYGIRPTTDQKVLNSTYVDAIVWVKPGGESDGTSDESATRFDAMCKSPVAHVPAPEAGEWFNDFVVNLVKNADPPLRPTWI